FAVARRRRPPSKSCTALGDRRFFDARRVRPCWDAEARMLWWQRELIKQYHHEAANQRCVLSAFEEQGWPARIDDALPREAGVAPKARLRETVKSLNRDQLRRRVIFHADGTGMGIYWEPAETRGKR